MSERLAPAGKVWLCMMCGKTTQDCFGEEHGWDESCALNCILVDEATKQPTAEQAREFHAERERRLDELHRHAQEFSQQIRDGTWEPDPELMELAQQIIDARAKEDTHGNR